jgi:hypothetical protein
MYAMAKHILDGDALTAFELAATIRGNQTVANFRACLNELTNHIFPRRSLVTQKHWMRYYLRKDEGMTIREFVGRVVEMNNLLSQFPPFGDNQKLPEAELNEVLEFAVPPRWQKKMIEQDFEPTTSTNEQFINFCERWERLELTEKLLEKEKESKKPSSKQSPSNKPNKSDNKSTKWCDIHQVDSHNTVDCSIVKNARKRHFQEHGGDANQSNKRPKTKPGDSSKPGKRPERTYTRNEVNAIMQKVAKAMTDKLSSGDGGNSSCSSSNSSHKRKHDAEESSASKDSYKTATSSEHDLGVIEEVLVTEKKLGDLNLKEGLDDDEISNISEKLRAEALGLEE